MYIRIMRRFALLAPALLTGCYTYAPIQSSAVQPGTGVRARVSATAAEQVAPLLGVTDARLLTGTLIDNRAGVLIVEVPTIAQSGGAGSSVQSLYQRISIAPGDLVELESRTLDRRRTAIVVGAAAIIAGSATIAALKGGPGLDRPPGVSSTDAKIPFWRLHF
jgi:hypothetical protein